VTIQSAFRGCRARRQLRQLLSRVRVDRALEILIREITSIENNPRPATATDPPPAPATAAASAIRARELLMSGRLSAQTGGSALPKQFLPIPPRQTANRSPFKTPVNFEYGSSSHANYNTQGTSGSSNYDSNASPSPFTGLKSSASANSNYTEAYDQSYMMNNIRAEAKQQLLEPTPQHKRLVRNPRPVPPTLDLQQQQPGSSAPPPRRSVQFVSPRSVITTPVTGNSASSAAGTGTSDMLSPFLGLHDNPDEGEGFGYISTPSASQSLSRSLTETFGQVATTASLKK